MGTTSAGVAVFLTRDPIGYADGPNIYCYVHCNPITHFDAWGLFETEEEKAAYDAAYDALINDTDLGDYDLGQDAIDALKEAYGNGKLEGDKDSTCKIYFSDIAKEFGKEHKDKIAVYDPATGQIHFSKSLLGSGNKNQLAASAAHEGTHKVQHDANPDLGTDGNRQFEYEMDAYIVGSYVEDALSGRFSESNDNRYNSPQNEGSIYRRAKQAYPSLKSDPSISTAGIDQLREGYSEKYSQFVNRVADKKGPGGFSRNSAGRKAREKWLLSTWEMPPSTQKKEN